MFLRSSIVLLCSNEVIFVGKVIYVLKSVYKFIF